MTDRYPSVPAPPGVFDELPPAELAALDERMAAQGFKRYATGGDIGEVDVYADPPPVARSLFDRPPVAAAPEPEGWTLLHDNEMLEGDEEIFDSLADVLEDFTGSSVFVDPRGAEGRTLALYGVVEIHRPGLVGLAVRFDEETGEPRVVVVRRDLR